MTAPGRTGSWLASRFGGTPPPEREEAGSGLPARPVQGRRTGNRRTGRAPRPWRERLREPIAGWLFVLPVFVLFVIFRFFPVLGTLGMSFTNYQIDGEWHSVGARNYVNAFHDPILLASLRTTLLYAAIYVPLTVIVALVTAVVVNAASFGRTWLRGALFLPYVTSFVLAGVIWRWVLAADGLVNGLLAHIHVAGPQFLATSSLVLPSLATVSAWKGFGYSMLILYAGLRTIPQDVIEAGRIDGANAWHRFFRIQLPLLRPTLFFVIVIETINSFQVFDTVYAMTGGGPERASYTLVYAMYDQAFRFFNLGYAATIGVIVFVLVLIISLLQRWLFDRPVT